MWEVQRGNHSLVELLTNHKHLKCGSNCCFVKGYEPGGWKPLVSFFNRSLLHRCCCGIKSNIISLWTAVRRNVLGYVPPLEEGYEALRLVWSSSTTGWSHWAISSLCSSGRKCIWYRGEGRREREKERGEERRGEERGGEERERGEERRGEERRGEERRGEERRGGGGGTVKGRLAKLEIVWLKACADPRFWSSDRQSRSKRTQTPREKKLGPPPPPPLHGLVWMLQHACAHTCSQAFGNDIGGGGRSRVRNELLWYCMCMILHLFTENWHF